MRRVNIVRSRPYGKKTLSQVSARDVFLLPFASSSIWNTPIGSDAQYVDAGLAPALGGTNQRVANDPIFIGMDPTAPVVPVSTYPWTKTTSGEINPATPGYYLPEGSTARIPVGLTHDGKYNGILAFLSGDDSRYYWSGQPLWYPHPDKPGEAGWPGTQPPYPVDLYGDGILGGHGGSRLSALGGVIRAWEWSSAGPIQHALSMNLYGYRFLSQTTNGYRWPAVHADTGYDANPPEPNTNVYGRTGEGYDGMKMGSLLALPVDYDVNSITNTQVRRIAIALRDYGTYVVDNTKRDVHAFSIESTTSTTWNNAGTEFHSQLMAVITDLKLIDNNASDSIGGGGTPLVTPVDDVDPPA